jgi:hypothetical protein
VPGTVRHWTLTATPIQASHFQPNGPVAARSHPQRTRHRVTNHFTPGTTT